MWRRCSLRHALCLGALSLALSDRAHAEDPPGPPQPATTAQDPGPPASPGLPARLPGAPQVPLGSSPAPGPIAGEPQAEVRVHENGRLAALLCQGLPLRLGRCRYSQLSGPVSGPVSGLVLTYHPTGSVAEVLAFRDGWLDGVAEAYDETGHLIDRTLYRAGVAVPLSQVPAAQVPADPPLPPPPSVPSEPGPDAGPAELASEPKGTAAGAVPRTPRAPLDSQAAILGLGLRGLFGGLAWGGGGAGLGGGQAVLALSPSLGAYPELAVGVTGTFDSQGMYRRLDVPVSLGLVVHLSRARAPLYMTVGLDTIYARRSLPGDVPGPREEEAWLLGGTAGLGVNLPMWGGAASQGRMLVDLRLGGTGRIDGGPALLIPQASGEPQAAIGGQLRLLLTLTAQINLGG